MLIYIEQIVYLHLFFRGRNYIIHSVSSFSCAQAKDVAGYKFGDTFLLGLYWIWDRVYDEIALCRKKKKKEKRGWS